MSVNHDPKHPNSTDAPYVTQEQWRQYIHERDRRMLPVPPEPDYVERYDGADIVAWDDVPEQYQKKILEGTMSNEDWVADWDYAAKQGKPVEDVVNELLSEPSPVARHLHVWRKDYDHCMIKTCGAKRTIYG